MIALKDELFGGHEEILKGADGSERKLRKGFIERLIGEFKAPIASIFVVAALILLGWGVVKIWYAYRIAVIRYRLKEHNYSGS